jgi:ERCC4-type nuclease
LWTVGIGEQDWYCRKSPISILNNIYGVGPVKAKQVLQKYGSVGEAMVNCREWLPKRSMEWLF